MTLVGTGGAGKTRLALELAARVPGTSWLVELASLGDGESLAPAVLGALGLREATLPDRRTAAADAESRLLDALGVSDALLVLDNCEHIVVAAAELADRLLAGCPRLRILATSREPLGIGGEALAPVGPLEEEAAVLLFAQRAASATPDFALDETTAPIVADVCRRIDGLPLAIELAAARLRSMSLQELSDRLHDRFRLLTGGSRAAAGRQRTLRAVVDWSWDLLSEPERRLARRLSVFPAGATLDAVEAVCAGDGVDADEVFDLLCALVDRSLLGVRGAGTSRWRMLETIREYAEEEAERAGELQGLREAHAAHYTALVQQADEHLRGPDQLPWLARLRDDRDNVLSGVRFLGETGGAATALRTVTTLLWFWALDGNREDALAWLRFALSAEGEADPLRPAARPGDRRLDRPGRAARRSARGGQAGGRAARRRRLHRPAAAGHRRGGRRVRRRRPGARQRDARRPGREPGPVAAGDGAVRPRADRGEPRRARGDARAHRRRDRALPGRRRPLGPGGVGSPSSPRCTCSTATSTRPRPRSRRASGSWRSSGPARRAA